MRRAIHGVSVILLAFAMLASAGVTTAQEASPEAGPSLLEGLGLPVLEVTVTAGGVDAPAEVEAGPVLFVAHNETEEETSVDVVRLPEGFTVDDYLAFVGSEGPLPEWTADAVVAGYVWTPPMASGSIVLNLAPGDWEVIVTGADVAVPSVSLSVTGEATEASIPADFDLELGAYVFNFPETMPAGPQIWHATNTHAVPHHAIVFPVDRLYTAEEVQEGVMAEFSGTPVADGFSFETSIVGPDAAEVPVITGGQEIWMETNLEPGYYVAVCFVSDPGSDVPHLMAGMISSFEVTGDA